MSTFTGTTFHAHHASSRRKLQDNCAYRKLPYTVGVEKSSRSTPVRVSKLLLNYATEHTVFIVKSK